MTRLFPVVLPFLFLSGMALALAFAAPAPAQTLPPADKNIVCTVVDTEIIPLLPPRFEAAAVWKKIIGVPGKDRPRDIKPLADGGVVVVGETVPFDREKGAAPAQIHLLRLDKDGVVAVEKRHPLEGLVAVAAAEVLKDRIVVLSHTRSSGQAGYDGLVLSFFDGAGELKSTLSPGDPAHPLVPRDIISSPGGKGLVVAATRQGPGGKDDTYSTLIWTDETGREVARKDYLPGVPNRIEHLRKGPGGHILAIGRAESEKGRASGWFLRLGPRGDIVFQRTYPRGAEALLRRAVPLPGGGIVAIGDSIPSLDGSRAAWILRLDSSGTPLWQKYMTGKYSYAGLDIALLPDGRLSALLGGRPDGSGGHQHARIVTLSPLGTMLADEPYLEGNNTLPEKFLVRGGERLFIGMSETGFSPQAPGKEENLYTYDSLVLSMASLPPFTDPCAKGQRERLDDLP